ncbi:MAG TPA: hypothetical protein VMI54_24005 [Polyangiaceae bacterium]|nr:hypothetical protein [Polyangiaceae bacterium]
MKLLDGLRAHSVTWLVRIACYLALVALAIMVVSLLVPRPLPVIFAMSVGHLIGILAFACYFASVLLDTTTGGARKIRAIDSTESGQPRSERE